MYHSASAASPAPSGSAAERTTRIRPSAPMPGAPVAHGGDQRGIELQPGVRVGHQDEVVLGAVPLGEPQALLHPAQVTRAPRAGS